MRHVFKLSIVAFGILALGVATLSPTAAEFETPTVETLPDHEGQGWFWATGLRMPNATDGRAFLFDQEGKQLGQLSTGYWFANLIPADTRGELLTVETYFSRGTRGTRTDIVAAYDPKTLSPTWEVKIPPKRLNPLKVTGTAVLTQDEKYLLVVNYTPAQSVSVVDLDDRRFVQEIETPGCSVLYEGGNRDFFSICGNGGFLHLRMADDGQLSVVERTAPLFDPVADFLSIAASRIGNTWYFVSKENYVYTIEMTEAGIKLEDQWSLVSKSERGSKWGISGFHHTAVHEESGRLFVLMHQGEPHEFEGPGTHVWVYDVAQKKKIKEIAMNDLTVGIGVSQGENPKLLALDFHLPIPFLAVIWMYLTEGEESVTALAQQIVNIYDADIGKHLGRTDALPNGAVTNVQAW